MMTLKVCTGVDEWGEPQWTPYTVNNVHIQNVNEIRKATDNTEILLRAVLFVDSRLSSPQLDYESLMQQSEAAGRSMRALVYNAAQSLLGEFEVVSVDPVPDVPDTGTPHHIELGLT